MHGGTARYVLHLHQVAPRILVCAHDFLLIVGEEYERVAISGALVAELLRNFVVHICHGNSRIQNNLEAQPSQIALINGTQRALEHRNVCSSQPCGNFTQFIRLNRRKHFRIKLRRLAFVQARDNIFDNSTFHFKRPLFCSTKHFFAPAPRRFPSAHHFALRSGNNNATYLGARLTASESRDMPPIALIPLLHAPCHQPLHARVPAQ